MIKSCITNTAARTWEQHACASVHRRKLMITTAYPTLPPTSGSCAHVQASAFVSSVADCWAEAPIKIARMTLTIKLDGNWSSFQLANSTPPLSVTDSAIAPSARMAELSEVRNTLTHVWERGRFKIRRINTRATVSKVGPCGLSCMRFGIESCSSVLSLAFVAHHGCTEMFQEVNR